MAQKVQVLLIDDLDGSEASETVSFALDGTGYEIDLNTSHAARLREDFASWVGAARRGGSRGTARPPRRPTRTAVEETSRRRSGEIRAWARQEGRQVSDRGRIPAEVVAAYDEAHR